MILFDKVEPVFNINEEMNRLLIDIDSKLKDIKISHFSLKKDIFKCLYWNYIV